LTRQNKRQKLEHKKLDSLAASFFHLVEFMSINDISNLGLVCKELQRAVMSKRDALPWTIVYETLERPSIGYEREKFTFLGIIPMDYVSVFEQKTFKFYITNKDNNDQGKLTKSMILEIRLLNKLWEESNNEKDRDVEDHERDTEIEIYCYTYDKDDMVFIDLPLLTGSRIGYGNLNEFLEDISEEENRELRLFLSILYACMKRISRWKDNTLSSYPSAEYLMCRMPIAFRPFFPPGFDRETKHSDRTAPSEFIYHPAPSMEEWLNTIPEAARDGGNGKVVYYVDSIPWYKDQVER